ncbi:MAG TPA: ABC transporter ATP-binding protein [Anaerolineales bacterium]|nr:ABC transporter ATP-binding protein [Anaerolineales bacterium]
MMMIRENKIPFFTVKDLSAVYPDPRGDLHALGNVSFSVHESEFVCVLGPSGSGKSTLLRMIAGLLKPTTGTLTFSSPGKPKIGFVFQSPNLMPWRTVRQNIQLPLEIEKRTRDEIRSKTDELIQLVGLEGFEDNLPRELSGGMAQRVSLARALIHDPDILLLDEPFGSLDALTREKMWMELSRIWNERRKTLLMVTHSISESLFMADRVIVLSARPGKIKFELEVTLPRPRLDEMRFTPEFGEMAKSIKAAIE